MAIFFLIDTAKFRLRFRARIQIKIKIRSTNGISKEPRIIFKGDLVTKNSKIYWLKGGHFIFAIIDILSSLIFEIRDLCIK